MLKKILSLFLSLLLIFSLTACGGGSNANLKAQIQNCTPLVNYAANTFIEQMDTLTFGKGSDGKPIEWIVLEKEGSKALLLSKYLLAKKKYNEEYNDITWENCGLREWLDSDFMKQTFSRKEQNSILTIDVINSDNERYGTKGGNNTKDKIFLLSIDEFKKYFPKGSEATYKNGSAYWWWLRSPGYKQSAAAEVDGLGQLQEHGAADASVANVWPGVRPALWVKY